MTVEDEVRALELQLLSSAVRRDSSRARELLHEDFLEIGRSGRIWDRDAILAALQDEGDRPTPTTDEWMFTRPAPGLMLVVYLIRRSGDDSRHASLWDVTAPPFRLRFHQGTVIPQRPR